jgi:hypothetical protein
LFVFLSFFLSFSPSLSLSMQYVHADLDYMDIYIWIYSGYDRKRFSIHILDVTWCLFQCDSQTLASHAPSSFLNLRMCRSNLESVFIVGFYSYCGEVRAAKKWGGEGQVMALSPAVHGLKYWTVLLSFSISVSRWDWKCICLHKLKMQHFADASPGSVLFRAPHARMVRGDACLLPSA